MITVELWGDLACFCPPYGKTERLSYPVPTPSALRGALSSIYGKPKEFYWAIRKIEVMNPIQYISIKRNEISKRVSGIKPINANQDRLQRTTVALRDVRYRVTAEIMPAVNGYDKPMAGLVAQALRRIEHGQCYRTPWFGMRDFTAYFKLAEGDEPPIQVSEDLGLMVFDTHIPYDNEPDSTSSVSLYHAVMNNGVIIVPDYNSHEVMKLGVDKESLAEGGGLFV